jgi:8-oxo-dGTP pyrophosphatase MutT (NUDIX family)
VSEPTEPLPVRRAARVLLVDPENRVLLFRSGPRPDGHAYWYPVGGEVEAGESFESAVVREAAEETGLVGLELGPEVLARRFVFPWREVVYDAQERWWLARVPPFSPEFDGMEQLEIGEFSDCRWLSLSDLAAVRAAGDILTPANLLELLPPWLAGEYPAEPIRVRT